MNLLQLFQGSKQVGSKVLFDRASFSINSEEHVGLIGANGAGKTTLFKIIAGLEELDSGVLTRSQQLRLGYLRQESDWNVDQKVEDFLVDKNPTPVWEIKSWGAELGLTEEIYSKSMKTLSGGFRMRIQLQKLISQGPNLLLLDEPTNFLDLETTLILERFLQSYRGAFLLISHDREFLRRTTDHTMEIENQEMTKFAGNIDDYFEQKSGPAPEGFTSLPLSKLELKVEICNTGGDNCERVPLIIREFPSEVLRFPKHKARRWARRLNSRS